MAIHLTFPKVFGTGSFSKEELLDYNITQNAVNTLFEVPLGEEGFREIDITLIIKASIPRFGLFGQSFFNSGFVASIFF